MKGKDLLVLEVQDDNTLAEWCCLLNSWGWPDGLPDPMTKAERNDYDLHTITIEEYEAKRDSQIMRWIENKVGKRLISWTHNKERMSEKEFDLWWRGNYEGDMEAKREADEIAWERVGGEGPPPGYREKDAINMENIIDKSLESKLKKLLILSERGVEGEKENASKILNKLLKKHGLELNDITMEG